MSEKTEYTPRACAGPRLLGFGVDDRGELVRALDVHAGLIIASAARVLGNLADAEDIAQDIAEKLLKSPPTGVRSWPGFLRTIAVNSAVDQLRRRKDWEGLECLEHEADAVPVADDPEAAMHNEQRADMLRRAIANLSVRDGQIFALYYLGDLSHADIASQLNMTTNAVGVALHRLRARLAADIHAYLDRPKGDS